MKTIKFLSTLLAMATLCVACGDDKPTPDTPDTPDTPGTGGLVLNVSPRLISTNGQDAAVFEVLYNGQSVVDGVEMYDAVTSKPIALESMRFATTTSGKYKFWASYKTLISNTVEVEAVSVDMPSVPVDPKPESTNFKRRVLLTQFTGTECGYCPYIISALHSLLAKSPYDAEVVVAAAHLYNANDPAYLSSARLDQAMAVNNFPMVVVDMDRSNKCSNYGNVATNENKLKEGVAKARQREALGGIAVNSTMNGNTLVIRATVKAAEAKEFRVGAWLLEDGIYSKQSNYGASESTPGEFDTHNNCIRLADSKVSSTNYTGLLLGQIEKGAVGEHIFTMTLDDKWVKENCHLVVFITVDGLVNNAVKAEIGKEVAFDYN